MNNYQLYHTSGQDYWTDVKPRIEREFHAFDWYIHFGQFLTQDMKQRLKKEMI